MGVSESDRLDTIAKLRQAIALIGADGPTGEDDRVDVPGAVPERDDSGERDDSVERTESGEHAVLTGNAGSADHARSVGRKGSAGCGGSVGRRGSGEHDDSAEYADVVGSADVVGHAGSPAAAGSAEITDLEQARSIALRRLAVRARSAAELKQDLLRRHVAENLADQIVTRFAEVGLVNDEDFARQWVTERRASKSLSTARLTRELRGKGVSAAVISAVLGDVQDSEFDVALKLARSRVRTVAGHDRATMTRRLAGQLERKGFSSGVVRRAVVQAVDEALADE